LKKTSIIKARPKKNFSEEQESRRNKMGNALTSIQAVYFRLEAHFNDIFGACATNEQKDSLRHDYINARDTYWDALAKIFHDNDPVVIKLIEDTNDATKRIDQLLTNLQNIVEILKVVHEAVGLASKIATLAGVPA
jgi:hypothetical protein